MKKLLITPIIGPVLLVFIYLFSLVFGSLSLCTYSIYFQQKDILFSLAEHSVTRYLDDPAFLFEQNLTSDTQILIYDAEQKLIQHAKPIVMIPGTGNISVEKYLSVVLTGKRIYHPVFVLKRTDIIIITGIPIQNGDQITGALFFLRNLKNLPEAIFGFAAFLTIFYWIAAVVIIFNLRKNKKLDELRQTYIANVTHALKTPVASIKALSETLCDEVEPDPDKQKVYYGMILREANRQDHMIRDILELSKLQSSGMDFTKTTLRAAEIFRPVLDKYATLCDCMDIRLHISECLDTLPPLHTNEACVKQLLEILLDNAIKFTPEGGDIWVDVSVSFKTAAFCVRDDGVGIEKDALPQVFDRFFKGSHDFNSSGSGLGLAIAKEITAGLKERIWVESEVGKGSSFFFTIHLK